MGISQRKTSNQIHVHMDPLRNNFDNGVGDMASMENMENMETIIKSANSKRSSHFVKLCCSRMSSKVIFFPTTLMEMTKSSIALVYNTWWLRIHVVGIGPNGPWIIGHPMAKTNIW